MFPLCCVCHCMCTYYYLCVCAKTYPTPTPYTPKFAAKRACAAYLISAPYLPILYHDTIIPQRSIPTIRKHEPIKNRIFANITAHPISQTTEPATAAASAKSPARPCIRLRTPETGTNLPDSFPLYAQSRMLPGSQQTLTRYSPGFAQETGSHAGYSAGTESCAGATSNACPTMPGCAMLFSGTGLFCTHQSLMYATRAS
jgi:hypothetical protein